MNKADVRYLSIGSLCLLITGILLPCMTVYPQAGAYTSFIKMLMPSKFEVTTYSILSGILSMMKSGNIAIGLMLFVFSVIFPIWKLGTFIYVTYRKKKSPSKSLELAVMLGKYSMLDVFVLAVLVIAIKGLPGDSKLELEAGIYFFSASVLLSLFLGAKIKPKSLGASTTQ